MNRTPAVLARVGAGVALLAATALIGAPTAAHAAEDRPDLSVSFDRDPVGAIDNSGATIGVYVVNNGHAPATAVTLTLDLGKLGDAVEATVPEGSAEQCKLAERKIVCGVGQVDAGRVLDITAIALAARPGAPVGDAGAITVTVDGAEEDGNPADDTTTFPVTVQTSGADLVVVADDLNDESDRVGPGDKAPLYLGIFNVGDTAAAEPTFTVSLPTAATFVERYSDCTYVDPYPNDKGGAYVYGPSEVTCTLPVTLDPEDGRVLVDEATGESLFHVAFGRNLPGPEELQGRFSAALAGEMRAAKGVRAASGDGPSFADAFQKLQAKIQAKRKAAPREVDEEDNDTSFRLWTKPNTIDIQVTAKPITGAVGQTVELPYEVINNGPSDGGGPSVLITAPTGTVLLPPADWCWTAGTENELLPESKALRCSFESDFPTIHSGYGRVKHSVKLKIKSTPGADGTIYGASGGVASTESSKANNTAKIVFTGAAGGGNNVGGDGGEGGGEGGGLPITGAPAGLLAGVGGAIVLAGVVMLLATRRRQRD